MCTTLDVASDTENRHIGLMHLSISTHISSSYRLMGRVELTLSKYCSTDTYYFNTAHISYSKTSLNEQFTNYLNCFRL